MTSSLRSLRSLRSLPSPTSVIVLVADLSACQNPPTLTSAEVGDLRATSG